MNQLKEIKQKLNQNFDQIKQQYQIKQLGIFGSYIRGEATENSDLDILVEFEPQARFGLLTFCELENYLSELLAVKVDLVMKDSLKPQIGKNILQEVVYL
ncbi:MAG: nucleotidyltransferase family protein [Cyanobacteria bacterium P01_C01_bin.72]